MEQARAVTEEMDYIPPRLGTPLIVCSVVVIAGCLFLVSIAIAMFTAHWEPCVLVGGLIFSPLFAFLGLSQYRATFRRSPSAAGKVSVLLLILGGFMLIGFVVNFVAGIDRGKDVIVMAKALPFLLTPALLFIAAGILNRRWARTLRLDSRNVPADDQRMWRFSTRELLLATAAVAVISALSTYFIRSSRPRYAEHVTLAAAPVALPPGSTDVCYARGPRGLISFEFTTDEATFRDWVAGGIGSLESEAANVPLKPIGTPFTMWRYYFLAPELDGPDSITIIQGLYYQWTKEDRGVYAAFDSQANRAYFFYHGT